MASNRLQWIELNCFPFGQLSTFSGTWSFLPRLRLLFLTLISLLSFQVFAGNYRLFLENSPQKTSYTHLSQVPEYDQIIENLKPGDHLQFDDGNQFEYLGHLGKGRTTTVLKVRMSQGPFAGHVMALRLPLKRGALITESSSVPYVNFIDDTLQDIDLFARNEIGPQVFARKSKQYIAVELLEIKFDLETYLKNIDSIPPSDSAKVREELLTLAKRMAGIMEIKDIHADQIVYDGKRWVLADWFGVALLEENNKSFDEVVYPVQFSNNEVFKTIFLIFMKEHGISLPKPMHTYAHLLDAQTNLELRRLYHDVMRVSINERYRMLAAGKNPLTGHKLSLTRDWNPESGDTIKAELDWRIAHAFDDSRSWSADMITEAQWQAHHRPLCRELFLK